MRPPQRQHLLLAARERPRHLPPSLSEHQEEGEHSLQRGAALPARRRPVGAQLQILQDRERGKDAPPLRHVRDAEGGPLVRPERRRVPPAELEAPGPGAHRARDGLEQRGLAGPVGSDDGDELALRDLERSSGVGVRESPGSSGAYYSTRKPRPVPPHEASLLDCRPSLSYTVSIGLAALLAGCASVSPAAPARGPSATACEKSAFMTGQAPDPTDPRVVAESLSWGVLAPESCPDAAGRLHR
jgi:hypothetical protein